MTSAENRNIFYSVAAKVSWFFPPHLSDQLEELSWGAEPMISLCLPYRHGHSQPVHENLAKLHPPELCGTLLIYAVSY
jgi:hypothetical protein